ncbi:MAG: DegV family protein [Actinobacteria bacterium HGW-Actinobacteria-7]|jgi:DegV family protein with EDD domain|nr:MAG: DegV family protein [Actinobacteria bacterium HGW-Actinobacteria-7]
MPHVGIVTDSTCDLAPDVLSALDVRMVPLKVLIGEESWLDWIELAPEQFYERLVSSPILPKTSQPSPAEFSAVYKELADAGCDSIVSIHLTSALSGTVSSATIAAQSAPVPVHVIDTKKVTQALALVVKAAAQARDEGADGDRVAQVAAQVSESMRLFFVLDTLDYLVKGGRAGKASGLAASLLNIKPVLTMNGDGIIEPFKKVKGRKKALAELANHVAEESRSRGRLRVSLFHACTDDCGLELKTLIENSGADAEIESVGFVGSVVGTYAGPNALGCAFYPLG